MNIVVFAYHNTGVLFLKSVLPFTDVSVSKVYTYDDYAPEGIWFDSVLDFCLDHEIPVSVVRSVHEARSEIRSLAPDVIFSVGCRDILTDDILNSARIGCINLHGSLLPKYRGRAPLNWAILNGENETAVTAHFMTKGLDHGDIIRQERISIEQHEPMESILQKLYAAYDRICPLLIEQLLNRSYKRTPQSAGNATTYPERKPIDGAIDWKKPAAHIERVVRATSKPYPGAFTFIKNQKLIIDFLSEASEEYALEPGEIQYDRNKTIVGTGTYPMSIDRTRVEGSVYAHGRTTRFLQEKKISHFNDIITEGAVLTNAGTTTAQNVLDALYEMTPNLHAVDMDSFCYAKTRLGRRFHVVPPLGEEEKYRDTLLELCLEAKIRLIIPCSSDDELLFFCRQHKYFQAGGIKVAMPSIGVVYTCDDKRRANAAAVAAGLRVPRTFESCADICSSDFPVVVKAVRGDGSKGMSIYTDTWELAKAIERFDDCIIQEYVDGPEYTVDIAFDSCGAFLTGLARERVAIKDGICVKTRYFADHELIDEARSLCQYFGLVGVANVQFKDGRFIEINPRLPGGLGLSMLGGICWPLLLVKIFLGKRIWPGELIGRNGMGLRAWRDIPYESK